MTNFRAKKRKGKKQKCNMQGVRGQRPSKLTNYSIFTYPLNFFDQGNFSCWVNADGFGGENLSPFSLFRYGDPLLRLCPNIVIYSSEGNE